MPENVIVTIKYKQYDFEKDMELPANIPISELLPFILTTLKEIDSKHFMRFEKIFLLFNGAELNPNSTLSSEGIWDGSILELKLY
mgnify:CR=1 FL=1